MGEAIEANINVRGLFDYYRWDGSKLDATQKVETEKSRCRPEDRAMIASRVEARGGWQVLDKKIYTLRHAMSDMLAALLHQKKPSPILASGGLGDSLEMVTELVFDWKAVHFNKNDRGEYEKLDAVAWRYSKEWTCSMEKLQIKYGTEIPMDILQIWLPGCHLGWAHTANPVYVHDITKNFGDCDIALLLAPHCAYPMGAASFPLGAPEYKFYANRNVGHNLMDMGLRSEIISQSYSQLQSHGLKHNLMDICYMFPPEIDIRSQSYSHLQSHGLKHNPRDNGKWTDLRAERCEERVAPDSFGYCVNCEQFAELGSFSGKCKNCTESGCPSQ